LCCFVLSFHSVSLESNGKLIVLVEFGMHWVSPMMNVVC
jgi:hypothetical protein